MRRATLFAAAAFVCTVGFFSVRAVRKFDFSETGDPERWALCDFRDVVYYPVVSMLEGHDPYDAPTYVRTYRVGAPLPPYSPSTLLAHLPFGLAPLVVAGFAYFAWTIVLMMVVSYLTLLLCGAKPTVVGILGITTAILLTRPGNWNLLLGQLGTEMTAATYLALQSARKRPWVGGFGLAVTTIKPTYGIPLAVMMLARGELPAVVIGVCAGATLLALALAVLAVETGGLVGVLQSLHETAIRFPTTYPTVTSINRVDVIGLVSRLLGTVPGVGVQLAISLGVLAVGVLAVRRLARRPPSAASLTMSASITCLVVLTWTYHLTYDVQVITLPLVAAVLALTGTPWSVRAGLRFAAIGLLAIPFVNYLASTSALDALRLGGTWQLALLSLNGTALLAALGLHVGTALSPGCAK
jgi:hypothetical protein